MNKFQESFYQEIIEILKKVAIFADIGTAEDLKKVSFIMQKRSVPTGELIITEGTIGDEAFILLTGSVRIEKKTLQNEEYTVVILNATTHPLIGELGLLDSDKRSATVSAETPCELLVINRQEFIEFGDKYPHLGLPVTRQIAKILSGRLRKANQDVISLFSALVEEVSGGEES